MSADQSPAPELPHETPTGSEPTGPPSPGTSTSGRPAPQVSGYEIAELIGTGGQGDVYRARHLGLNRIVALKILRNDSGTGHNQWARFRREARVIAQLDHPNIVRVLGYDESAGPLALCMEYLPGGSLKDRIARAGRFSPQDAVDLLVTLTAAVAHAHTKGIVHRDLKPANVLFTADGQARIVDFGLAKVVDETTSQQTQTGAILGSPSYMAPEQAAGKINLIGRATDVYGLGAILYELLAGRPPFSGQSWLDTLDRVRFQPPVPLALWRPDVPPGLEQICLRCLEKAPDARYADARELARVLLAFRASWDAGQSAPATQETEVHEFEAAKKPSAPEIGVVPSGQSGSFRLVRRIRAGAFGEVWSALAPGGIKAAVKIHYRPIDDAAPELKALHLIKNLNHPYLLKVQSWWVEDGRLHVAMELADGALRGRLRKGRPKGPSSIPLAALLMYVREAAEALDYMHGKGLIHRNVTPENILLVQGHVKIGDFSLVCDAATPGDATAGAIAYMAPECFRAEVMPQSDQYSLAVTYTELRVGRRPFPARTTFQQTMRDALENSPDLGELDKPERMVLRKALAKEPTDRYPNCRDFADALTAAVPKE
jgi:serine/threonine protein kinase